ncbi:MAG: hypothetical protein ACLFNR_00120 [Candidatus Paceibacterota bacterium]
MNTRLLQKLTFNSYLALALVVALLAWSVALPVVLQADEVSPRPIELQNTLTDSAPGVAATHTISFKIADNADNAENIDSIKIDFASSTEAGFELEENNPIVSASGTGGDKLDTESLDHEFSEDPGYIIIDVDSTKTLAEDDEFEITIGGLINPDHTFDSADNPMHAETHTINVNMRDGGTSLGKTDTEVAIIEDITMTAAVETIFEFSVEGLGVDEVVNEGATTTTHAASSTRLDFGIIDPDEFYFIGQELTVSTNASNGFVVTVQESQELTSSTGERIHRFNNATTTTAGQEEPIAWEAPSAELEEIQTYGHYGITTNDSRLNDVTEDPSDEDFADENGFVGNFHQEPRPLFGHTDSADGETQDIGVARVGVGIEISPLQPAGDDYTNTLTYVATPTF